MEWVILETGAWMLTNIYSNRGQHNDDFNYRSSGSGKSAYAEQKILEFGALNRIYIATMYPLMRKAIEELSATEICGQKNNFPP